MDAVDSTEPLNERERAYLEHVKQAQELGVSLSEYCKSFGLNVQEWYGVKRDLVRRGVLPGRASKPAGKGCEESGEAFIPVRIAPSTTCSPAVVCRIRHPQGWVFECMQMPEASWVAALIAEDDDAASVR
jgi:hypothetical protein